MSALSSSLARLPFRRRIEVLVFARLLAIAVMSGVFFVWPGVWVGVAALFGGLVLTGSFSAWEISARRQFVREASLPPFLAAKLRAVYPQLDERDTDLVLRGLRQFFMAHLRSNRRFVAMPSKLVDAAWHEFILHTKGYQQWCQAAFGGLLHHSPAEILGNDPRRNDGLRRTWFWACKDESIDPRKPSRLPLLFALDAKFGIEGGYRYTPDCKAVRDASDSSAAGTQCGSSFSDSDNSPGDAGGFGGSDASSSDASSSDSPGSSDSGSGCGGGGCGGGGD